LNARLPEVMYTDREQLAYKDLSKFNAVSIGPGLGNSPEAKARLASLISNYQKPIIFDADALNILAEDRSLLEKIPANSVITPHVKEFDRFFGEHNNCWDRIETAFKEAKRLGIYIVLKNRYTMIFSPDGLCCFNSSGSPAMA